MNIAMFSWEALEGLPVGGGAVYASRLAAALARAGHRVRLFTRMGRNQAMDEIVGGVYVRHCPWDRKPTFFQEIQGLNASFAHYFADALHAEGPFDVVHCHEWMTVGAGLRAADMTPARLAMSFHSTEWARTSVWPDSGDSARIAGLERDGIARADAVIAASYWMQRKIHEQFHPPDWKCEVVYHGADLAPATGEGAARVREELGIEPGAPCVFFAGRFSRVDGGDLAARACGLAAERFPLARFVFMGAGPLEEEMRRSAGPGAVFLPPEGRLVPAEYYRAADLVLAPFRRNLNGRAVLPAWVAGKPVVVLAGTVPAEFIMHGTNGWEAADDDAELSNIIATAFADPENTAWMGRNGRTAVETAFGWDESARRLVGAYRRRDALTPPSA